MTHAVEIAGVDQVNAGVYGCMDGGQRFRLVRRPMHSTHAHAPKGDGKDFWSGSTEFARLNGRGHWMAPFPSGMVILAGRCGNRRHWSCVAGKALGQFGFVGRGAEVFGSPVSSNPGRMRNSDPN